MKARNLRWLAFVAVIAMSVALKAEATLKVGDPAPRLQTGKWVQGEPVKKFDSDKAYIVEFWATWCGPCRVSIPHLNEIYEKYKDKGLVVIGQNCWERDESLVGPFVKKMGEKMTYRVALDDKSENKDGAMAKTWMAAAGQNGIPSAFLVDKHGVIAWIGHPMGLKEMVIEQVLAGTFDAQKAAQAYQEQKANEAELMKLYAGVNEAMHEKKWDEAEAKLGQMSKLLSGEQAGMLDNVKLRLLFGKEDYEAAYKLVTKISDADKKNAMLQNDLAWQIATDPAIKQRNLKVAELCASRANAASEGKDAAILDTVARVKFMEGEKEEALQLQKKAVSLAEGDMKAELQKRLEDYERGELSKAD